MAGREILRYLTGLSAGVSPRGRTTGHLPIRRGIHVCRASMLFGLLGCLLVLLPGRASAEALPDGRAYEQVSPLDKAGSAASGTVGAVHSSADGNRFFFFTVPTFPGSEGAQDYGSYLSTRDTTDWNTIGLLPPSTLGREAEFFGASDDLSETFSANFNPTTERYTLFSRDSDSAQISAVLPGLPYIVAADPAGGGRLLFESSSLALPGGTGENNVFLREKATGIVRLVSVLNTGESPLGESFAGPYGWQEGGLGAGGAQGNAYLPGVLSPDGESVYFTSASSGQLFLRVNAMKPQSTMVGEECTEAGAACTTEVSRSQRSTPDPEGPKGAAYLSASWGADPAVFFLSSAKLTDDATTGPTDEGRDLYRYDVASGELVDLVPDPGDPNGADVLGTLGSSSDGSRIYFAANGVLGDGQVEGATPGACKNGENSNLGSGECNLYVWVAGKGIHYIARLDAEGEPLSAPRSDQSDWYSQRRQSTSGRTAHVSQDGRTVVFRSRNDIDGSGTEGVGEYYRYQEGGPGLQCLTCVPTGLAPLVGKFFAGPTEFSIESATSPSRNPNFTPRNVNVNGNRFFFETGDRLVPEDVNGLNGCPEITQRAFAIPRCQDVYEWEAEGEGSCRSSSQNGGCIHLISSGRSDEPSFFGDADSSGANVFFYTQDQLVPQDKDRLQDVYDAREGGGLSGQQTIPSTPCSDATACGGPVTEPPPSEGQPGSLSATAVPSAKKKQCRKGTKRARRYGRTVCVKKKHRNKHQSAPSHQSHSRKAATK